MYSKCMSCRLYDSLICGRLCKGYSHFEPINRRLYHYVDSQKQVCGPVEAYLLPFYGVNQESYVWTNGMRDWTQVSRISELCFIPSVSATRIQDSVNMHTRENMLPTILGNIPLGTKIVYALYLLALFSFCCFHMFFVLLMVMEYVDSGLKIINVKTFLLVALPIVCNIISFWGLYQLFLYQRKAGFWFAVSSIYMHFVLLLAFSFGYDKSKYQIANDIFLDYFYPILGAFLGLVLSYVFIGVLWFSLYFKRKGVAFISRLNNEKLIFPMSLLRLFPALFLVFLMVMWTIYSVFF